jgi:hypothetical protein
VDFAPIKLICFITLPTLRGGIKAQNIALPRKIPDFPKPSMIDKIKCPKIRM